MYLTPNFVKHRISKLFGIMALLIISVCFTDAQSRQIDNPTPLTSNEISGVIEVDSDNKYYYSFWANPGEVTIKLIVEPGKAKRSRTAPMSTVFFSIWNQNRETTEKKNVSAFEGGGSRYAILRLEIAKRQLLTLEVDMPSLYQENLGSKYHIIIGGSIESGNNTQSSKGSIGGISPADTMEDENILTNVLPKKGTLRIKMKDGTIKRIDLSKAEEITIEP